MVWMKDGKDSSMDGLLDEFVVLHDLRSPKGRCVCVAVACLTSIYFRPHLGKSCGSRARSTNHNIGLFGTPLPVASLHVHLRADPRLATAHYSFKSAETTREIFSTVKTLVWDVARVLNDIDYVRATLKDRTEM